MFAPPDPEVHDAWQALRLADEYTAPRIRAEIERLAEPVRTVALYHFGWSDKDGTGVRASRGKGVRGALVLATARALGCPPENAARAGAAVELVHNFSLLHDDLMDADHSRRGRPAAWTVFGPAQAILAGDALLVLALDLLTHDARPAQRGTMADEMCRTLLELVAGQGADLAFEGRLDVSLDECLTMTANKTASLLAGACAIGALTAAAEPYQVGVLRAFGHHLGLAFQLMDDFLDIWGDPDVTGKPVGSDLRQRKKSLPVVAALHSGTDAGRALGEFYDSPSPMTDEEAAQAMRLLEAAGAREWVQDELGRHHSRALEQLAIASLDPTSSRDLYSLPDLVIRRDH